MATSGNVQYPKMDRKQSVQRHMSKQCVRSQVACVSIDFKFRKDTS